MNILADKSLLAAFSEGSHAIGSKQARNAVADSEFAPRWRPARPVAAIATAALAGVMLGGGLFWLLEPRPAAAPPQGPPASAATPAAAPTPATTPVAAAPAPASPATPPSYLDLEARKRMSGYAPGRHALLGARLEATLAALDRAPDDHYALELYISDNDDPGRVERFLSRAQRLVPLENIHIAPLLSGGRYRIWALYGRYASREQAAHAAKTLPPRYQQAFPLVPRSFAELRRVL